MGFRIENRQDAIRILERALSERARYSGPPTFSYTIGGFSIDRNGWVEGPSEEALEEIKLLLVGDALDEEELVRMDAEVCTLQMGAHDLRNLLNMIHSKQLLIEKALGYRAFHIPDELVEAVGRKSNTESDILTFIEGCDTEGLLVKDGTLHITGFPAGRSFERLVSAMTEYASKKKYISPDETIADNEKYYMRAWLIRLGLDGADCKELRRTMVKNLKGHVAFRTEEDALKWRERHG